MATVEAHQDVSTFSQMLLGKRVRYQKHKPGNSLLLKRIPRDAFQIESVYQFGECMIINDGVIVMEYAPAVVERRGRLALLLPTGEEIYFFVE